MFIDCLMNSIEDGCFLTWEAVIRSEQGLPLSLKQQDVLNSLVSFSDCDGEELLYETRFDRQTGTGVTLRNHMRYYDSGKGKK